MTPPREITIPGARVTLLATPNGRARAPVWAIERATQAPLGHDAINPANKRERDRFLDTLDEGLRAEVDALLVKLSAEIQTRLIEAAKAQPADPFGDLIPWPEPIDATALLAVAIALIDRYAVLPPHAVEAVALWLLHTYVADVADHYPYLLITSPTRQCGKTTLLEIIEHTAFRAIRSDGYTAAALYRRIDQLSPTLLLDELDTRLRGDSGEALRGVLNSGFQPGGKVTICIGDNHEPTDFRTGGPKVLAGIGRAWDTVTSRSIPLKMQRATKAELRDRAKIRGHLIAGECLPFRQQALRWANDTRETLRDADPNVPEELGARQADVWRPLLAIADVAGGEWPKRARDAAKALHGVAEDEGDYGLLVLSDALQIVRDRMKADVAKDEKDAPGIFTATLLEELRQIGDDRPWAEYTRDGKSLSPRQLASLLGRFGIKPRNVRAGDVVKKGYAYKDLKPAFARYLEPDKTDEAPATQPQNPLQALQTSGVADVADCTGGVPGVIYHADGGSEYTAAEMARQFAEKRAKRAATVAPDEEAI